MMKILELTRNLKLKQKIVILFILSVMVPVVIMTQLIINESIQRSIENTVMIENNSFELIKKNIENELATKAAFCMRMSLVDSRIKDILSLNRHYKVVDNVELYSNFLTTYERDAQQTNIDFTIYYHHPNILQNYVTYKKIDETVKIMIEYRSAVSNPRVLVVGQDEENGHVYLARTIEDSKLNTIGVAVVRIACDNLENMMGKGLMGDDKAIAVCSEDGSVILSETGLSDIGIDLVRLMQTAGAGNEIIDYRENSQEYKVIIKTIFDSNLPGWKIVNIIAIGNILEEAIALRNRWLFISIAIMVGSCILFIVVIQMLTARIGILMKHMEGVADGQFITIDRPFSSHDEIGTMTHIYNQMVVDLRTLIHENYEKNLRLADAVVKKQQAELFALQSQIHPHFLFNTLGSISMKIRNRQPKEAEAMLLHLSKLLRKSINWEGNLLPLGDELDFVVSYLEIQHLRYKNHLSYSVDCPQALKEIEIPKFIVQPLVENAVVHGIENKIAAGHVDITAQAEQDRLVLIISDNGIGISPDLLQSIQDELSQTEPAQGSHHIGLNNVHSRLMAHFGRDVTFTIESKENEGTTVAINLPLRGKTDV